MADAGGIANDQTVLASGRPVDAGLGCLGLVLAIGGEAFDLDRARREYIAPGQLADSSDLLRIARAEGLKARLSRSSVKRIQALSLPVIARHRDGTYFVIGRRTDTGVLIGVGGGPPVAWTLDELDAAWSGEVLLAVRRDRLAGEAVRF